MMGELMELPSLIVAWNYTIFYSTPVKIKRDKGTKIIDAKNYSGGRHMALEYLKETTFTIPSGYTISTTGR